MTETFYDVLGVTESATTDEIEAAYRERLKETHPDVSDDEDASQATKDLIEARDVLVDEDERARYDRIGHDAYVGNEPTPSTQSTRGTDSTGETDTDDANEGESDASQTTESRASRERRARERVREERRRTRRAERVSQESESEETGTDSDTDDRQSAGQRSQSGSSDSSGRRRRSAGHVRAGNDDGATTYSVRQDVPTGRRIERLVPTGRELTLLGMFFPLYPVLLFSTLLPSFPLFVNLVLGVCTLLMISYLQSMPRVALVVFGGWSVISFVGLGLFGIGYLSALGLLVLATTVLPFGFSVLTATALRL